jgi:TetR/AcrR family fatty acid metabolism transcriptional regulator
MVKSKEEVVQEYRVQSIQEAAMRVISRKGMNDATMADIAKEAGIAKGTIYLYFRDRDELVEKTFETAIAQLHERVDTVLALDLPIEEKLRELFRAQMAFFRENAEFFRLYLSLRIPSGSSHQKRWQKRHCAPQYQQRIAGFASVLEDAMKRGEVRKMDSYRLALFLIEGAIAITFERLNESAPPAEESDVDLIVGLAVEGIVIRKQKRSTN